MKKNKSPAAELAEQVEHCAERYRHWERERKEGCKDPNWSDGVNLNLVRTHIINAKKKIRRTCDKFGLVKPAIYYRELSPEVPEDLFVLDGKNYNAARVGRIMSLHHSSTTTAWEEAKQMRLF